MLLSKGMIDGKYPFIILDDFFDGPEIEKVMLELNYLRSIPHYWDNEVKSSAALDPDDITKIGKSGKSVWLKNRLEFSNIVDILNKKYFLNDEIRSQDKFFNNYRIFNNNFNVLINYYENFNFYKKHFDDAKFTLNIFMFNNPKNFQGGDFMIEDSLIECKFNRAILFPGFLNHGATNVKLINDNMYNSGRFAITTFIQ